MPTSPRHGQRSLIIVALVLVGPSLGLEARATPLVHADPAGLCGGHSPCFTTLAAAVAQAGPAPARVLIFPGTYAESVDLNTMGSAVGGGPGALSLISVDAGGQPAPGALVDPAAPGGPGTGAAIRTLAFPGALKIDGLVLRSPDDHALELPLGTAAVTVSRLDARSSAGGNGILVLQDPGSETEVRLDHIRADGSARSGVVVEAIRVVAGDLTARNNGADGIRLGGREVVAERLLAEGNVEDGVSIGLAGGAATFSLSDITVRGNNAGLAVFAAASATSSVGVINGVAAAGNLGPGIFVFADALTAKGLSATQNEAGMLLLIQDQLLASNLGAIGNTSVGVGASAVIIRLADVVASENRFGIAADGDLIVLEGCSTSGNGGVVGGLSEGAGYSVRAGLLEARNTTAIGNEVGWLLHDDTPLTASLLGRRAALGWRASSTAPQNLTILRSRIEASHAASMQVRLFPEGRLTVACSDLLANGPPGFSLETDNAVDARANFWGNASGPLHPTNPGGSGDAVLDGANGGAGSVSAAPFLVALATDDDCPAQTLAIAVPTLSRSAVVLLAFLLAGSALAVGVAARSRVDHA